MSSYLVWIFPIQGAFKFTIGRTLQYSVTYNTLNIHLNYVAYENCRQQSSDGDENELCIKKSVFSRGREQGIL